MKEVNVSNNSELVLIADDDTTTRIMMREMLETHGFEVVETEDGMEALEAYEQHNPAALILDIDMPHKDGLSVCSEVREKKNGEFVPIVISTGFDDIDSINNAYKSGATDFIAKPINWAILGHRIQYIIRASAAIAEYKIAEERASRLGKVVENSSNEIFVFNSESFLLEEVNSSARQNLGLSNQELSKMRFTDLLTDLNRSQLSAQINPLFTGASSEIAVTAIMKRKDDSCYQIEMRIHLFDDEKKTELVAIAQTITDRDAAEERMRYLAFYDVLTGLPNRQLFTEELEFMIRLAHRGEYLVAVLFIDLDNFKRINDTLGHSRGDMLLMEVARRLKECVRDSDYVSRQVGSNCNMTVSRLGGDEFTVVLNNIQEGSAAAVVAQRILTSLNERINLDGHDIVVTPSIGIALAPWDSQDVDSLLQHADTAMYHAKSAGRNNFQFYSKSMNTRSLERLTLENELRQAIERKEFSVYYQPVVDIETCSVVGAEALVRWKHPIKGLISPAAFIPLAEEMGLIVELGALVFYEACKRFAHWLSHGLIDGKISINLSSLQFNQPNLIQMIGGILVGTNLDAKNLELEMTESIIMDNVDKTITTLHDLKNMSISLSIDDFGTGYSSLSYLKKFPLDTLKIDRSFVSDVSTDSDSRGIASAIIAMADSLNLNVVAEGVENDIQLAFLKEKGVRTVQGFLFSRPLPAEDFENFLKNNDLMSLKVAKLPEPVIA